MGRAARMSMEEKTVEVDRENLLIRLRTNRQKHVADYEEALQGYQKSLTDQLQNIVSRLPQLLADAQKEVTRQITENLTELKTRSTLVVIPTQTISTRPPECQVDLYDDAIAMTEADVRATLTLSYSEFKCLWLDQWEWKAEFDNLVRTYKG